MAKPQSLCALALVFAVGLVYCIYATCFQIWVLGFELKRKHYTSASTHLVCRSCLNHFDFVAAILRGSYSLFLSVFLLPIFYHLWFVRQNYKRVVSQNIIFHLRVECVISVINDIFWFVYLTHFGGQPAYFFGSKKEICDLYSSFFCAVVLLSVLIAAPRYFVVWFLAVLGVVLIFTGGRPWKDCGYFAFACSNRTGRTITFCFVVLLWLCLLLLMCLRHRAAHNLRCKLHKTMDKSKKVWDRMVSRPDCPLFVKAYLVSNRDSCEHDTVLRTLASQAADDIASDFYRASALPLDTCRF